MKNHTCKIIVILCYVLTFMIFGSSMPAMAGTDMWNVNSDTWVLHDGLDREMPKTKANNDNSEDRRVLIFYHNWHYEYTRSAVTFDKEAPRNVTRILSEHPEALTDSQYWGPGETYHYWGEPIWGYYSARDDEYVIRKHAQMLTDAGVDGIVFDYTNYLPSTSPSEIPYKEDFTHILEVFLKIKAEGGDVPQVVIMATWDYTKACHTVENFYEQFYTQEKYQDLWFMLEGKPLFLAWDHQVSLELKDYFTLRRSYPFNDDNFVENEWPWNSSYPQKVAYTKDNPREMITVGVAGTISTYKSSSAIIGGGMGARDENGYFIASGRSSSSVRKYLTTNPVDSNYNSQYGYAFQECFDRAIELDPSIILVTGWNEWIAARFVKPPSWSEVAQVPAYGVFFDQFCAEFSRDIEPTRDGNLQDHFYNQLAINIRRYKGGGERTLPKGTSDIVIDGDFTDWDNVEVEYRDDLYDTANRNAKGIGKVTYVNETGRNDFKLMKVAYDKEMIYFYVETTEPITSYTDDAWMNLYIRIGDRQPDWEGYQYVVNRSNVRDKVTTLEKSTGGYNWETVNDQISYNVSGCKMELAIPRKDLDIPDNDDLISLDFKWHDNMQVEGDFFEFYLNGDCAPNERFNYRFSTKPDGYSPNKGILKGIILGIGLLVLTLVGITAGAMIYKKKLTTKKKGENV